MPQSDSGHYFESRLIQSFSKHVKTYDHYAQIQKSMAERLASLLPDAPPQKTLEIGCGTGIFTRHLLARTNAKIILNDISPAMVDHLKNHLDLPLHTKFVIGNAERLRFSKVQLIASNAVFQWFQNPEKTIHELSQCLEINGTLVFSTFGPRTLHDFREIAKISGPTHLVPAREWKKMLSKSGLKLIEFHSEMRLIFFPSTRNLMKNLQQIGAAPLRLMKPGQLRTIMKTYDERFASSQGIYTGWELYFFSAEKTE